MPRKSVAKNPVSTKKTTQLKVSEPMSVTEFSTNPAAFQFKRSQILLIVGIIVVAALLYFLRSWFIVAIVNGKPITRLALIQELDRQAGKQVLNSLVTKTLILQEANKEHVSVSQQEVQAEVKKTEDMLTKQGQNLDTLLAQQGRTRADFVEQIMIQKLVEKMLAKDIAVSDKEISDYIDKNKDSLPQGTSGKDLHDQVKNQLQQQKLSQQFQPWIQNLQKQAKITYILNY